MRKFTQIKPIIITLGMILVFSILTNTNFSYYQETNYGDLKTTFQSKMKRAGFWEIGPIEIDDNNPLKNWSITAFTYDWCKGSGTWNDPYFIENVTIDGQKSNNCIRIDNSDVYFKIRNCTLMNGKDEYWHSGGIRLKNVTNGRLIDNDCSFNQQGIYLTYSNNITISGNRANNNTIYGIVLNDQCNNNKIIKNTVNLNGQRGIQITDNNNQNIITGNNASNNLGSGIYVCSNNSKIINNTANNNGILPNVGEGIIVECSKNVTVAFNNIQGNDDGIIFYNNQDCKIFNNTVVSSEYDGLSIERCVNFIVSGNNVSHSGSGIMLRSSMNVDTYNNTVSENTVINTYYGIYLFYTNNNTILRNILKENYNGIHLHISNYNNISGNILIGNDECITEFECEGNIFENNVCTNNHENPIITGYNVFLLIGAIFVILVIVLKKLKYYQ